MKFGLVIENYEAVNSTDEEFEDSLKQGEIRVAWYPEGKEEILPESNVSVNFNGFSCQQENFFFII